MAGVKVAVYTVPEPWKLLSVPPVTATSAAVKSVLASLSVKVSVTVWLLARVAWLALMLTVGGVVSTGCVMAMLTALSDSAPSWLNRPSTLNLLLVTMTAALLMPALGVKVAV